MKTKLFAAILLCVTQAVYAHKIPDSEWQAGILKDMTSTTGSRTVGTLNQGHGVLVERETTTTHCTIQSPQYVYLAHLNIGKKSDLLVNVTVKGPITFAIEGSDLYLKDESGKIHKLVLESKTLIHP